MFSLEDYARFTGRARRKEFWTYMLVFFLLYFVGSGVDHFLHLDGMLTLIIILGTVLPLMSVSVRRLHDVNLSGWWYLLGFVPIIGGLVLLFLYLKPSDSGTNKFGDKPKELEKGIDI